MDQCKALGADPDCLQQCFGNPFFNALREKVRNNNFLELKNNSFIKNAPIVAHMYAKLRERELAGLQAIVDNHSDSGLLRLEQTLQKAINQQKTDQDTFGQNAQKFNLHEMPVDTCSQIQAVRNELKNYKDNF